MASNPYYEDYATKNYGTTYPQQTNSYQQYGVQSQLEEYQRQQAYAPNAPTLHVTVQQPVSSPYTAIGQPQQQQQIPPTHIIRESPRVIVIGPREPDCCSYICSCLNRTCDCLCSIIVTIIVFVIVLLVVGAILKYAQDYVN